MIVLDGAGIGELPDASAYGDAGSNTIGHVAHAVLLRLPTLRALGLGALVELGAPPPPARPLAAFGKMAEMSPGKDSVTGHWELMGVVLERPFPVFPSGFPTEAVAEFERRIGRSSIGNVVASGTEIIETLGPEHLRTGSPILYTSADSVCQIAAHEQAVPIDELYRYCEAAFDVMARGLGVGRIIARPFVGEPGAFRRTIQRRDFAQSPPGETLLDRVRAADLPVVTIGKADDLFAGRGITEAVHAASDAGVMDALVRALRQTRRGLLVATLVDFDTLYGHRNDVPGYAANLEQFDDRLAALLPQVGCDDLLIITADHGNDPTTPSTDHSREHVPLLAVGAHVRSGADVGVRRTFADLGQTIAAALRAPPLEHGTSMLTDITGSDAARGDPS